MERKIVWSNQNLNLDDWSFLVEEHPGYSEEKLRELMIEENIEHLYDERSNLNIKLGKPILVVADLGLWDGRRTGYKEIQSGNIADCLYANGDYTTWYVDENGEFLCDDIHHDGTNHYRYRVWNDGVTDEEKEELRMALRLGIAKEEDIVRYTQKIGDKVAAVYGWEEVAE